MEKTIYVLYGRSNIGKTSTIKIIFELLKQQYPDAIIETYCINGDIKVIITINNIKIGLESQGDPNARLKDSLKDFTDKDCTIILCAARSFGMTHDWIKDYSSQYKIIWIKKIISEEILKNDLVNQKQAQIIVKNYLSIF